MLYDHGRLMCDNYGRLKASPEELEADVLTGLLIERQVATEDVVAARDALVRAGIWHLYTVHGVQYIEDMTFDDDQNASWLQRRGAPEYPDPPDRPDLAYANREHYQGKPARVTPLRPIDPQPPTPTTPIGGAVPPAGAPPEVPPQAGTQGAAPAEVGPQGRPVSIRETPDYQEYLQVCRDGNLDSWTTFTAFDQLVAIARSVGNREWQVLIPVAQEAALSASGKPPSVMYGIRILNNLPADVQTRHQAELLFRQRRDGGTSGHATDQQGGQPPGLPPGPYNGPRPLDTDHIE